MPDKAPPKKKTSERRAAVSGIEGLMPPRAQSQPQVYEAGERMHNKVAIVTGGDSGIGRAVAVCFAKEGADVVVVYYIENEDAEETKRLVEKEGRKCLLFAGDLGEEQFCREVVQRTVNEFGRLDVLVNNSAEQHPQDCIQQISEEQLEHAFRTNVFSFFYMCKAAIKHIDKGGCIINTASVTAYRGSAKQLEYSATKGAIVAFTRSLALALADKGIRVNGVAPGPSAEPSSGDELSVEFGAPVPMKRSADPDEIAPCFVFLASNASSYMTGQFLHPNGGEVING